MVHFADNFRCHVPGRTASLLRVIDLPSAGHPKISKTEIPRLLEYDIFWLQVAVDDISRMNVLQRQNDATQDKFYG